MLLLGRKQGESIYMPSLGIEVKVVEIRPHLVRLGISAPREVAVLRHDTKDTRGVDLAAVRGDDTDGRLSGDEE